MLISTYLQVTIKNRRGKLLPLLYYLKDHIVISVTWRSLIASFVSFLFLICLCFHYTLTHNIISRYTKGSSLCWQQSLFTLYKENNNILEIFRLCSHIKRTAGVQSVLCRFIHQEKKRTDICIISNKIEILILIIIELF